MSRILFALVFVFFCLNSGSGQDFHTPVKHFTRVVASPHINVILKRGDEESVRVVYRNVDPEQINVAVKGKTLKLYLDGARKLEKRISTNEYDSVWVTAYVTYKELELLEIRGSQQLTCLDPIQADAFTLRGYGENDIHLTSLKVGFFKAKLYGRNDLRVLEGRTLEQKYKLHGNNRIDSHGLMSDYIITSIFGEGLLRINSLEEVRIDAFGEPRILVDGGAQIHRRLVFGNADIQSN